jgi:hypothetical protein
MFPGLNLKVICFEATSLQTLKRLAAVVQRSACAAESYSPYPCRSMQTRTAFAFDVHDPWWISLLSHDLVLCAENHTSGAKALIYQT